MLSVYTAANASETVSENPWESRRLKHVRIRKGGIAIAEFQLIIVTIILIINCQISIARFPSSLL